MTDNYNAIKELTKRLDKLKKQQKQWDTLNDNLKALHDENQKRLDRLEKEIKLLWKEHGISQEGFYKLKEIRKEGGV